MEPNKINFAVAPISIGHTFGNMTANIVEMVKGYFSNNYFKTINVSSKVAHRYFNILDSEKAKSEFMKRNKPFLIIRPRVELLTRDTFLANTFLTTRMTNTFEGSDYGNLQPFFLDLENKLESRYLMNRHRMSFDVIIIVESMMEQINIGEYLRNIVRWEMPMTLHQSLECQIPSGIIKGISQACGIDYSKNTADFVKYMNAHSQFPITHKLKNSSGNEEFFRYYGTVIDAMFRDLAMDDGNRKGMVEDAYTVSFTIDVEFPGAGLYHLFTTNKHAIQKISCDSLEVNDGSVVELMFTLSDLDKNTTDGWALYGAPVYTIDRTDRPDRTDLSTSINKSLTSVMDFHIENNIPIETAFRFKLKKDNEELVEGKDYKFDLKTRQLTTFRVAQRSTYRFFIYVNVARVNDLGIELAKREEK